MNSQLMNAAKIGDLQKVKRCVSNLDEDIDDWAAVVAAEHGHLEVLKYLVGCGVDFSIENDEAFRMAAENGRLDIIKYLMSLGVKAWVDEAVDEAASAEHFEVVRFLIDNGASFRNWRLLEILVLKGNLELVKRCVLFGASVRFDNDSPLRLAAKFCQFEMVKYLVSKGADVCSQENAPILSVAMTNRDEETKQLQVEIVKYLVSLGGDVRDREDLFLAYAITNGKNLPLVKYFVSLGAPCKIVEQKSKVFHDELEREGLCTCIQFKEIKFEELAQCIICHDDLPSLFIVPCDSNVDHFVCVECKPFVYKECPMCRFKFE